jgi:hypothetical protein
MKLMGNIFFYIQSEDSPSYVIDSLSDRIEPFQDHPRSRE